MKYLTFLFLLFTISCVGPVKELYPPANPEQTITIHIVNHDWHTGIIVNREQAIPYLSALKTEFSSEKFLEIGWGDADFYQSSGGNSGYGVKALLWPTDSVMHVVGFKRKPILEYLLSDMIELKISASGFKKMLDFINESFDLGTDGLPIRITRGLYGRSWFFESNHTYHLFYTCNSWTAEALRETGYPISTFYALTAGNVMNQLRNSQPEPQ